MIEDGKLTTYLQRWQTGRGLPEDPRDAANSMVEDGLITDFQAEQYLLGKWRGFTIGKYKLLERVGVGGMGQVFLCEHMYMKRRVAIKVLPPGKAEQPAALGRFYREARAAGSLEHPNIVRTHDIDQDGNLHFIVMEYVDGSNLLDMVKKFGPMDVRRACHYVRQIAVGLDFAFRSGIIHRDIKPGNVLIDRRGVAKILDMGLARFYKDQTDMLTVKYDDKIVLGTADYVAPEQVANSHTADVQADIYAMGASFYFLLAGHPAFPSGSVSQKLLWHRTKDPTSIRQIRPEVPEGLAAVLAKMLAKDPNARYQTPIEVAAELDRWATGTIPEPLIDEMPKLSPAATEDIVLDEANPPTESTLLKRATPAGGPPLSRLVKRLSPAPPSELVPRAFGTTTATAVAPAVRPSRETPRLAPAPLTRTNPRPVQAFPPSPFAPPPQEEIQTLTAVARETMPAEFLRPSTESGTNPEDTLMLTKIFGSNSNSRVMLFVVLVSMCATLAAGLFVMVLIKFAVKAPATPVGAPAIPPSATAKP
jgi:serine/threonine protein kinase